MMPKCCGREREGPFCNQCGKQLMHRNGLYGLLCHVRLKAGVVRTAADRTKDNLAALRTADKWESWLEHLVTIMQQGHAAAEGAAQDGSMAKLIGTGEVAERLGVICAKIRSASKKAGVGGKFPRHLFSEDQVAAIKAALPAR